MITDNFIRQQIYQLQIDIRNLEVELNKLKILIHEKKYTLDRLIELLEIRGISIDDE
jgi:hypothetical protein